VFSSEQGFISPIRSALDTTGIKCSSDLVDPELLLLHNALPLKLDNGIITVKNGTIIFNSSHSSLLELQLTMTGLTIVSEV